MRPVSEADILFISVWEDSRHDDDYFLITRNGGLVEFEYRCLFDAREDDCTVIDVSVPLEKFHEQLRIALAGGRGEVEAGSSLSARVGMVKEKDAVRFDIHDGQQGAYQSVPLAESEAMLATLDAAT